MKGVVVPGSCLPADTSFTIVAPALSASRATTELLVSMDIGTPIPPLLVNCLIIGITRASCTLSGMGSAPGLHMSEINEVTKQNSQEDD